MYGGTVADLIDVWSQVEIWRALSDHPGYSVSSFGNVRGPRGYVLAPSLTHDGYPVVSVAQVDGGRHVHKKIHLLVLRAFIGPAPFEGAMGAHNDGVPANNKVNNLRWASALENQADRERHATRWIGSEVNHAKLHERDIPAIRARIRSGEKYQYIADDYGVSISTISLIKRGRCWDHVPEETAR